MKTEIIQTLYKHFVDVNKMVKLYISFDITFSWRIFVPTVLATLPIRTASQGESFAFIPLRFYPHSIL